MKKKIIVIIIMISVVFVLRKKIIDLFFKFKTKHTIEQVVTKYESKVFENLKPNFDSVKIDESDFEIAILAFKDEQKLEVYIKNDTSKFNFFKTYKFTGFSGLIGPKLKNGDKQIPEGIYNLDYLNPNSRFHLSLKVSYPNSFDMEKAKLDNRADLGGDIMIHGKSATIGCIPIGDENIEELFILSAKSNNKKFPIIISPTDFRTKKYSPKIDGINWEEELYLTLKKELTKYESK